MTDALARVAAQLRRGMKEAGTSLPLGPFVLCRPAAGHPYYRACALAAGPCADWRAALDAMSDATGAAGRSLPVELVRELAPGLPAALAQRGYRVETEAQVWLGRRAPTGAGGALRLGPGPAPGLAADFLGGLARAFDASAPEGNETAALEAGLEAGRIAAAAWIEEGRCVAGAALLRAGADAELAGVWTDPARRRRGLARQVCASLLQDFFAGGGSLAWTAALGTGEPLYRSLGWQRAGTLMRYVPPAEG